MKGKKDSKNKIEKAASEVAEGFGEIKSKADLKAFLQGIRDKMTDEQAAPVYAMAAMNYVMNLPEIYTLLDNENKEVARDVWLRIKQSGLQVRTPVMLFGEESDSGVAKE